MENRLHIKSPPPVPKEKPSTWKGPMFKFDSNKNQSLNKKKQYQLLNFLLLIL